MNNRDPKIEPLADRCERLVTDMAERKTAIERNPDAAKRFHGHAVEAWKFRGLDLELQENPVWKNKQELKAKGIDIGLDLFSGQWNGYCTFASTPFADTGEELHWLVPVHGGITFCQKWADGSITFGFDTGHYRSEEDPLIYSIAGMKQETEKMATALLLVAMFETQYHAAKSAAEVEAAIDNLKEWFEAEDVDEAYCGDVLNMFCELGRLREKFEAKA